MLPKMSVPVATALCALALLTPVVAQPVCDVYIHCEPATAGFTYQAVPATARIREGTALRFWISQAGPFGGVAALFTAAPGPGFPWVGAAQPGASTPTSPQFTVPGTYTYDVNGQAAPLFTVEVVEYGLFPHNGGTVADPALVVAGAQVLNVGVQPVVKLSSLVVLPGGRLTLAGGFPCTLRVRGPVIIAGVLDADGKDGQHGFPGGAHGEGGPGGGNGGWGGNGTNGNPHGTEGWRPYPHWAEGTEGGEKGEAVAGFGGGGGGGSNATAGTWVGPGVNGGAQGSPGALAVSLRAGAGGGGGAAHCINGICNPNNVRRGGGGGGGGGYLAVYSDAFIAVGPAGMIRADGGNGGDGQGPGGALHTGGGGGGSGGRVELAAPAILVAGILSASGGQGGQGRGTMGLDGGHGGYGCIRLFTNAIFAAAGAFVPAAGLAPHGLMLNGIALEGKIETSGPFLSQYFAALSSALGPPIPAGALGVIEISLADPLFALTFPINLLAPTGIVTWLQGITNVNDLTFDLPGFPPGQELHVWTQALIVGLGPVGLTNTVPIHIIG
ncbi:MAG: hypothetical protein CMJ83_09885 [Planctomycetes bacterium]|nr:hypothetical protein [Planctomycetota bacterium]